MCSSFYLCVHTLTHTPTQEWQLDGPLRGARLSWDVHAEEGPVQTDAVTSTRAQCPVRVVQEAWIACLTRALLCPLFLGCLSLSRGVPVWCLVPQGTPGPEE